MAKQSEAAAQAANGHSKNKAGWLIPGVLALVVLSGGGTALGYFLANKSSSHGDAHAPVGPPVFVTLEPYVVNLAGDAEHYLQVGIDLKVSDAHMSERVKERLPEIRNGILLLLSSKSAPELVTLDGKNALRRQIRDTTNRHLNVAAAPPMVAEHGSVESATAAQTAAPAAAAPAEGVVDVLLTSFVIQ